MSTKVTGASFNHFGRYRSLETAVNLPAVALPCMAAAAAAVMAWILIPCCQSQSILDISAVWQLQQQPVIYAVTGIVQHQAVDVRVFVFLVFLVFMCLCVSAGCLSRHVLT